MNRAKIESTATLTVHCFSYGDRVYSPCEIQRTTRAFIEKLIAKEGSPADLILHCGSHITEAAFFIEHKKNGYRAYVCKQKPPVGKKPSTIRALQDSAEKSLRQIKIILV